MFCKVETVGGKYCFEVFDRDAKNLEKVEMNRYIL